MRTSCTISRNQAFTGACCSAIAPTKHTLGAAIPSILPLPTAPRSTQYRHYHTHQHTLDVAVHSSTPKWRAPQRTPQQSPPPYACTFSILSLTKREMKLAPTSTWPLILHLVMQVWLLPCSGAHLGIAVVTMLIVASLLLLHPRWECCRHPSCWLKSSRHQNFPQILPIVLGWLRLSFGENTGTLAPIGNNAPPPSP